MLGDSLLVAPVFSADSKVRFYLPEGRWTDLLSGQAREGGRWFEAQYDYFSMPLYIRENSLLPMGTVSERPDYDYAKDLELHYYLPSADGSTCRDIVDVNGNVVASVEASRNGDTIKFKGLLVDAGWKIILHYGADEITTIMAKGESMAVKL